MCVKNSGRKSPSTSQLCCTAARFNTHTTRGFERNQEIVQGLLGKARTKLEKEEILQKKKMERLERNLYVKNLHHSINDERLRAIFRPFGFVHSAKIMTDNLGRSRGFGFVCFATKDEAIKARQEMHGVVMTGKVLYVSFAQLREVRQAKLKQKYGDRKESDQKKMTADQAWMSAPSRWGNSGMDPRWYNDAIMEDANEKEKMDEDRRNE